MRKPDVLRRGSHHDTHRRDPRHRLSLEVRPGPRERFPGLVLQCRVPGESFHCGGIVLKDTADRTDRLRHKPVRSILNDGEPGLAGESRVRVPRRTHRSLRTERCGVLEMVEDDIVRDRLHERVLPPEYRGKHRAHRCEVTSNVPDIRCNGRLPLGFRGEVLLVRLESRNDIGDHLANASGGLAERWGERTEHGRHRNRLRAANLGPELEERLCLSILILRPPDRHRTTVTDSRVGGELHERPARWPLKGAEIGEEERGDPAPGVAVFVLSEQGGDERVDAGVPVKEGIDAVREHGLPVARGLHIVHR